MTTAFFRGRHHSPNNDGTCEWEVDEDGVYHVRAWAGYDGFIHKEFDNEEDAARFRDDMIRNDYYL